MGETFMSRDDQKFKPYIPAEKITPEFTATSVIMGIILATVFGGANAYLGLRVGTTVSASIPAAVISMGVIRLILKRDSLLEKQYGADRRISRGIPGSGDDLYDTGAFPLG